MSARKISYEKLWALLKARHMPKYSLCNKDVSGHITGRTLAKMSKNQSVTTDTLLKVCELLDVDINDICETICFEE